MTTTNGHTNGSPPARPPMPTTLTEAKEQRELLTEQLQIAQLHRQKRLLESFGNDWFWGGSDLWDRVRPRTNDGQYGWGMAPPAGPGDRKHGADWPLWRTQPELDWLRQEARLRLGTNSYAKGLMRNRTNNVIGKGFAYKIQLIDSKTKGKIPGKDANGEPIRTPDDELVERTQAVVDDFLKRNRWNGTVDPQTMAICGSREREIYQAVVGDGEAFIRFHPSDDGLEIRLIDPSQIRDYLPSPQDGWSFGIQHRMAPYEDVETPEQYCVFWPDPSATGGKEGESGDQIHEEVPANEILHLKGPDTPSTVKRGLSQFLFGMGRALDRAERLQENASMSAAVRAANAEIWQFAQQTQAQVQTMAGALATGTRTDPGTGATTNVEKRQPGTVRRIPEGMEWVNLGPGQTEEYMTAKAGDLQMAASSSCSPAFWLGDSDNSNYSNLESASAPAVREGVCEQEYFKTAFAAVVCRAIIFAAERGELPEDIFDTVKLHVEAPAVLHRNELEKAQEDQISVQSGWKDRQTCAAERGLDWDVVLENNLDYQEQTGGMGGELPLDPDGEESGGMGGKPPGGNGKGGLGDGWGKKPPAPDKNEVSGRGRPAPESLQERLETLRQRYGAEDTSRIETMARQLIESGAV